MNNRGCRKDERGASAVEYGLIVGLITVGAIFAIEATGRSISNLFAGAADRVAGIASAEQAGSSEPQTMAGATCAGILASDPGAADGIYQLDPDNDGAAFEAYCDMSQDGGGWTLVAGIDAGNDAHGVSAAVSPGSLTAPNAKGKFADAIIDQLLDAGEARFTCGGVTHFVRNMGSFDVEGTAGHIQPGEFEVAESQSGPYYPVDVANPATQFAISTESAGISNYVSYHTSWVSNDFGCFNWSGWNATGNYYYDGAVYVR